MATCKKEVFGALDDGREVFRFWMENENGMRVAVLNYGAIIQSILVPDRNGVPEDVVLGYDTPAEYEADDCYFGATIGRVANRIAGAAFELVGAKYTLTANEGDTTLHGGNGFHKKIWEVKEAAEKLVLCYVSPDGEDGFPGTLKTELTFSLSGNNVLRLDFSSVSDKDTLCSLTGHSYFNLKGSRNALETVAGHQLQIAADRFTPCDSNSIPSGRICPVEGTDYDFRSARCVGKEPLDGNLILTHGNKKWDARVLEPASGRGLFLRTSLPGLQLYNGVFVTARKGKNGASYGPRSGLCLEPQFYPDAVHHPDFPQPVLYAGKTYSHFIEYGFSVL